MDYLPSPELSRHLAALMRRRLIAACVLAGALVQGACTTAHSEHRGEPQAQSVEGDACRRDWASLQLDPEPGLSDIENCRLAAAMLRALSGEDLSDADKAIIKRHARVARPFHSGPMIIETHHVCIDGTSFTAYVSTKESMLRFKDQRSLTLPAVSASDFSDGVNRFSLLGKGMSRISLAGKPPATCSPAPAPVAPL